MVRPSTSLTTSLRRWFLVAVVAIMAIPTAGAAAGTDEIIAKVKAAVVGIGTYQPTRNPAFVFMGTGFAVGDGTLVATNAHVIPNVLDNERREAVVVALPNLVGGQMALIQTQLVGLDRDHDLALLSMQGGRTLPAVPLGTGKPVKEGQSLLFTGFPIGAVLGLIPATHRGMVSALTPISIPRSTAGELDAAAIKRLSTSPYTIIQLDGTAYPGNSGSPLYDDSGTVVGIINMVFVKGARENAISQPSGISYAIPVQPLADLIANRKR